MTDPAPDLAILGSHAYGLFMDCERLPGPGESIVGWNFRRPDDGGKGSNQAICAGRLGARVLFIGKVGEDAAGDGLFDRFRRVNVDTRYLYRSRASATGLGFVLVDRRGETMIATDLGANRDLTEAEIDAALPDLRRARCFLTQFELPTGLALHGLRLAKSLGLTTLLAPSPVPALEGLALDAVDVLVPNEHEARRLAGLDPQDEAPPERVVDLLRERWGTPHVVMTRGARGVFALCQGERLDLPAFAVTAVNATGAGDAFVAALAVARTKGASWRDAIETGMAAAAISVTGDSTWGSYPTLDELAAFMAARGRTCPIPPSGASLAMG